MKKLWLWGLVALLAIGLCSIAYAVKVRTFDTSQVDEVHLTIVYDESSKEADVLVNVSVAGKAWDDEGGCLVVSYSIAHGDLDQSTQSHLETFLRDISKHFNNVAAEEDEATLPDLKAEQIGH